MTATLAAPSASKTAARRAEINEVNPRVATEKYRNAAAKARREQQRLTYIANGGQLWTPRRSNGLKFVDIFCGAGGSSIGLTAAGYELLLAANHWPTAIDTHAANFTKAEHLCADVNNYDFRYLPRGADVLWASPICTELSPAGGTGGPKRSDDDFDMVRELGHVSDKGKERTRATFMDVIRATEVWRFKAVLLENVPDVERWELFDWWLSGMERLGYPNPYLVNVNTAHVGGDGIPHGPQWRDRLYIVFIRKDIGRTPDLEPRPIARCFTCEKDVPGVQTWIPQMENRKFKIGRYRRNPNSSYGQYWYSCPNSGCGQRVEPYVAPAASVIDWSDLGVRIGDLPKTARKPEGLAPKTMVRIRAGIEKFGYRRMVAAVAGNTHERAGALRAWPADHAAMPTLQTTQTLGAVVPPGAFYVKNFTDDQDPGRMCKDITDEPFGTVTTIDHHGIVSPPGAFRVALNHDNLRLHTLDDEPLAACTTKQGDAIVIPPMSVPVGGTWANDAIDLTAGPGRTVMANEKGCEALVTPHGAFLDVQRNHAAAVGLHEPVPTITTARHSALVIPYYSNGAATRTGEPFGTVSTRDRYAMISAEELAQRAHLDAMDAFYRMLKPRESLRAQTFPDDYLVLGGSGEQTMQAGNAVSCNVAQWLGERVAEVLIPHPVF